MVPLQFIPVKQLAVSSGQMKTLRKILLLAFVALTCCRAGVSAQPLPAISALLNAISEDTLRQYVREITGAVPVVIAGVPDTIKTRQATAGNEKAARYILEKLSGYGLAVDSQVFNGSGGKNVFGRIPGTGNPNRVIILGAHYDNVGSPVSQGADDNASGVAAVLEAARVCRSTPQKFTLLFAFWDEEEIGLNGSGAYANAFLSSGQELMGYINLDQAGYDGNGDGKAEIHVQPVAGSAGLALRAQTVNTTYSLGLDLQTLQLATAASDQVSFWNKFLTAIAIGEAYTTETTPYRHTYNDTVGTLHFPYLTKLTKLALGTALTTNYVGVKGLLEQVPVVTVWPLPFSNRFQVATEGLGPQLLRLEVTDLSGRIVYAADADRDALTTIEADTWPSGTYALVVKSRTGLRLSGQRIVKIGAR